MTVAELIRDLKKIDPKLIIAWQDHDQSDQINNLLGHIIVVDREDLDIDYLGKQIGDQIVLMRPY